MNALRRTALLAGLITGIATGAAAFAAADDPAPPAGKTPDPYLGSWVLSIDGAPAGAITTVEGCNVGGRVVDGQSTDADERPLTISLGGAVKGKGLDIVMPKTGLATGDLAPRADGNRSYELYTESASLALR